MTIDTQKIADTLGKMHVTKGLGDAEPLFEALRALIDDSWSNLSGQPCVPSKATVIAARAALAKAGVKS
jgi:hypothetical protein